MNYSFLVEFDLPCDGQDEVWTYPWGKPSGHVAMDQRYKLEHAAEEITCLNIEIRQLVMHIRDEEEFLWREEVHVREECGEALAHQVHCYRMEQGRSDDDHITRLTVLTKLPGLTGTVSLGTALNKEHLEIPLKESEGMETMGAPSAAPAEDISKTDYRYIGR
jgi:hypothetical protein